MVNISYPSNYNEIIQNYDDETQITIKAQYNRVFEEEWNKLSKILKDDLTKILKNNHFHSFLISDFLKPFISNKLIAPFNELNEFSILILDPLYLEPNINQPTFDAILARIVNQKIISIMFIEGKGTKEVDDEYKKYKNYISDQSPLKEKIKHIITNKYPHLELDIDTVEFSFGIIIPEKRKNNWINSLNATKENIFLFSRLEDPNKKISFKLEWKPPNIDSNHNFVKIEQFFSKHPQLCTAEFEMCNSLDSLYNLNLIQKEYILKYQDDPINDNLVKEIIKRKAKAEYFETNQIIDQFWLKIFKIGLKYNLIYCKGLDKKYFFRMNDNVLSDMFVGFHLKEKLEENEQIKKDILTKVIQDLNI